MNHGCIKCLNAGDILLLSSFIAPFIVVRLFPLRCLIREQREVMILLIGWRSYVCQHTQPWRTGSAGLCTLACVSCSGAGREADSGGICRAPDCDPATYALKSPGNFRPNAVFWPPTVLVLAKNLRGGAWGCVFSQEGSGIIFVCAIRPGAPLWSNKMVSRNLNCCYLSLSQIYAKRLLKLTSAGGTDTFCSSRPRILGEEVFTEEARCAQWNKKLKQSVCEQSWEIITHIRRTVSF